MGYLLSLFNLIVVDLVSVILTIHYEGVAEWNGRVPFSLLCNSKRSVLVPASLIQHNCEESNELFTEEAELVLSLGDAHRSEPKI